MGVGAGMRAFGANRSGNRSHAAIDIYQPYRTVIHSVYDGIVARDEYSYYAKTNALQVDHGLFTAVYGEIDPGSAMVGKGDKVKKGQPIAKVGHLVGISVPSAMLHFEMYDNTEEGAIGQNEAYNPRNGRAFRRRRDLMDPSPFMKKAPLINT